MIKPLNKHTHNWENHKYMHVPSYRYRYSYTIAFIYTHIKQINKLYRVEEYNVQKNNNKLNKN